MPRRVFAVSDADARAYRLDDPEGLRAFLRPRVPDLDDWTATYKGGCVVLDHVDPDRPLHLLAHHRPGGRPVAHACVPVPTCADEDCDEDSVLGAEHCPAHLR